MDERLEKLWRAGVYPFNQAFIEPVGVNPANLIGLIPIDKLLNCLQGIAAFLKVQFQHESVFLNHDWHEHDGYISRSEVIPWSSFDASLKDTQSLYESRDLDYLVRITIYPESLEYILRYRILWENEEEGYPGIWGDFHMVIDKHYVNSIVAVLKEHDVKYCSSYPMEYFDLYDGRREPGSMWARYRYLESASAVLSIGVKHIEIRLARPDEVEAALSLALNVFMKFNAPSYTEEGIAKFVDGCVNNEGYVNNYITGRHIMFVALDGEKIVGMVSERGDGCISMLYVDKKYHRQGIATALMGILLGLFKVIGIQTATLFAAPYAVPFYHAYGFVDTDALQNNDSFIFTPMELKIM